MSTGFTKLFSSITAGTIWCEPDSIRIVWITMLAMMGADGIVSASIPGLAAIARVSIQDVEIALAKFLSPDKYSRTKVDEGRRIREVDGGWLLLNAEKYRNLLNHEATKQRKRDWWNKNRGAASKSSESLARQNLTNSTQEEVEVEEEEDKDKDLNLPDATDSESSAITKLTRKAYVQAFKAAYGVLPKWTIKANASMKNFVRQIGSDQEAAFVATHFLTMPAYGKQKSRMHSVTDLLRDADSICNDMRIAQNRQPNEPNNAI